MTRRTHRAARSFALAAALVSAFAAGCESTPAAPEIRSFTATPASVPRGQSSTLTWSVTGATLITIDNGVGDVTNQTSVTVTPQTTTTYQLKAQGQGTSYSTASVTVTVTAPVPAPQIASFTASPPTVGLGSSSTLAWSVTNASSTIIDNGVGDVTSLTSKQVTPTQTTTYKLTANGPGGTDTKSTTVTVTAAGLRLDYTDPTSTSGKKILLLKNTSASTSARLVLDVKVGELGIPEAFGVAMNLPLPHTQATFTFGTSPAAGILLPLGAPPLNPGTGPTTMAGKQGLTGPLADMVTIAVARKKSIVTDGNVSLPANAVLFSLAFDIVTSPQAPNGTLFDGASLPAKVRLAVLKKDGTEAAGKADFAIGQMYVTQ